MHNIETIIFGAKSNNMTVIDYIMENYSAEEKNELQLQLIHRMQKNRLSGCIPQDNFIETVVEKEAAIV